MITILKEEHESYKKRSNPRKRKKEQTEMEKKCEHGSRTEIIENLERSISLVAENKVCESFRADVFLTNPEKDKEIFLAKKDVLLEDDLLDVKLGFVIVADGPQDVSIVQVCYEVYREIVLSETYRFRTIRDSEVKYLKLLAGMLFSYDVGLNKTVHNRFASVGCELCSSILFSSDF